MVTEYNWVSSGLRDIFKSLFIITTLSSGLKFSEFFCNRLEETYTRTRNIIPEATEPYLQNHNLVLVLFDSMDHSHTLWADNISETVVYFKMTRSADGGLSIGYELKESEADHPPALIQFIEWLIEAFKEHGLNEEVF